MVTARQTETVEEWQHQRTSSVWWKPQKV